MISGGNFCGQFDKLPNVNKYADNDSCLVTLHVLKCSDAPNKNNKWVFRKTQETKIYRFIKQGEKWTNVDCLGCKLIKSRIYT